MTVREIIKELKKMPQNLTVAYQDFDADDYTISSWPKSVNILNFNEIPKDKEAQNLSGLGGSVVVIRG